MESKEELYNELASECGVAVSENEYEVKNAETLKDVEAKPKQTYAYGGTDIVPGESIDNYVQTTEQFDKNDAINNMVMQSAIYKAQKESAAEKVLTKEEKAAQKKAFVEQMMYQQEEAYYVKYHYVMDGHTKRGLRKKIERDYDKGKYRRKNVVNINE